MVVPSTSASCALLTGLLCLASCAKSDVPIDGPTSPLSGTVVPGVAAPGTVNLQTAPAMQVNVTLSAGATASDVMTLTISEELGNGRVTVVRNAVQGGGTIAFDPIDVTALDDGNLLLSLSLTNAAGTTIFDFPPVLKDTLPPVPPVGASIPAEPGSGTGSVPANTVNLLNYLATRVEVEFSADSRDDDRVQLTYSDGVTQVTSSFTAPLGSGTLLSPGADLSPLADGLVTIAGVVLDRANNPVDFQPSPALKDTLLAAPTLGLVAEGASNPEGFVNAFNAPASVVRVLFPEASLATDLASVSLSDGVASVVSATLNPVGGENSLLFPGLDASGLNDGPLALTMVVRDAAGNYQERTGSPALKDTVIGTPAAVRISAGAGNAEDVINASSVTGVVVQLDLDAATLPTDRVFLTLTDGVALIEAEQAAPVGPSTLSFAPLDSSALADGSIDVAVALGDTAGNRREAALLTVPKDTLVPVVPASVEVPMGPNNPGGFVNATNQGTATVTVRVGAGDDPDRSVRLRLVGGGGFELTGNRMAPLGDALLVFAGLDLSAFPEGLIGLEAVARDTSGNVSVAAQGVAVLDRSIVGPSAAVVPAGPNNDQDVITAAIEAAVTFRLSFPVGSAAGDQVLATLSDGANTIEFDPETAPVGGADLVIASVDTSGLDDGTVVLAGAVRDEAGNSAAIGPFAFEKDTTSPGAPSAAHVRAGADNELDTINLSSVNSVEIAVELPATYDGTEELRVLLEDTQGAVVASDETTAPAGGGMLVFGPLDTAGLADGLTALTVEVTDTSQNTANYAGTSALKDTLAPAAPTSAGVAQGPTNPADTINQSSQADVQVTVELPASYVGDELVSILLQDGVGPPPVSPRLTAPAGGGTLIFSGLDASGLLDGSIDVTVKLADGAGNELDAPVSAAFKDVVAPEVEALRVPPTSASALDTITAFDVDAVTVEIVWGANISGLETATLRFEDGVSVVESAAFPTSQTSVSGLDLSSLDDGELAFSVTAVDAAANETRFDSTALRKRALRSAPRFALVASVDDNTLTILQVDDADAGLRPATFTLAGEAPQALAVDYAARFVHVANGSTGELSSFRIDPLDGALTSLGTTATGALPVALALHPSDDFLLVASRGGNLVESFRVDTVTGALTRVSTAAAGAAPARVVADPSGRFVYATDVGSSEVWSYAIDRASGALSAGVALPLANVPTGLAVHPSGRYLYVGTSSSIARYDIDPDAGTLSAMGAVAAPSGDVDLALRPDGRFLYAVSAGSSSLSAFRIDAGALTLVSGPIGLSGQPSALAVGPAGEQLFVVSALASELQVFEIDPLNGVPVLGTRQRTRQGVQALAVAGAARGVLREPRLLYAVHASGQSLASYSVDPSTGSLSINDPGAAVGLEPRGLAVDPDTGLAFVVNEGAGTVTRMRLDAVTGAPIALGDRAVGSAPFEAAYDLSRRFLYVTNGGDDTLSMLAVIPANGGLMSLASPIAAGAAPGCVASDPTGQFVYVVNRGDGSIGGYRIDPVSGLLSPTSVPAVASGGLGAARVAVHPSGRVLYVTNTASNSVTVFRIEPATGNLVSLGQPTLAGNGPGPIALDPLGDYVIVGNTGSGDLSVYEVSRVTGTLVSILGPSAVVGSTVGSVAFDPSGRFLHASEPSADLIVAFLLNRSTGTLSVIETQGAAAGQPSRLDSIGAVQ